MKIILIFLLLILSILGLSDVLHSLKLFLLRPKKVNAFVVCLLNDKVSELNLKYVIEKMHWNNVNYCENIVAINQFESDLQLNDSCCLAEKHNIRIIKPNEFEDFVCNWSSKWSK